MLLSLLVATYLVGQCCCQYATQNLTDVCGIANVPMVRIVGGMPAKKDAWPWMTAIFIQDSTVPKKNGSGHVNCCGVLLSGEYVATSAHCVCETGTTKLRPTSAFTLRFADLDLASEDNESEAIEAKVSQAFVHPKYDTKTVYYDLALLRLEKPLPFSVGVRPICLPNDSIKKEDLAGVTPFVAGWGRTSDGGYFSSVLRQVQVEVLSNTKCGEDYAQFADPPIAESQICAGVDAGGKSACQGDSGAPLMLVRDSRWTLIGIMSSGTCGQPGQPDVYTRVTEATDWMTNVTGVVV